MSEAAGYPVEGRCLCGACTFSGRATAMTTSVCHCETCRRWTGGALFSVDLGSNLDIDGAAPVSVYASSSRMDRVRCKVCGAPLYRHDTGHNRYFAVMEALDDPGAFDFDLQIFIDEKPKNYEFANRTTTLTGAQFTAQLDQLLGRG